MSLSIGGRMPFMKIFHDPGIGFPWVGDHGVAITKLGQIKAEV